MRNLDYIAQLHCRLVALGCPQPDLQRLIQEIADHREDLTQAATRKGLSGVEAEAWVNEQLGNPLQLADKQMTMLRSSSWFGRYSLISFFLLPLLTVPVLWGLLMGLNLCAGYAVGFGWDAFRFRAAQQNPVVFHHLVQAVNLANYVAFALVTLLFCRLARRAAVGWRWMLVAGVICSLYALLIWISFKPHNFSLGVSWHPHWLRATVPLLVVGMLHALQWRKARNLRFNQLA